MAGRQLLSPVGMMADPGDAARQIEQRSGLRLTLDRSRFAPSGALSR